MNGGAENNIPDDAAFQGSKRIVELVKECKREDLLIVLITGGGSALFTYPIDPINIEELGLLVKNLSRAGATIQELNSVRKRLSVVKGGGLLRLCKSREIISLILSDVLGDPLDVIASGPTVTNSDPHSLAREIIDKYLAFDKLPNGIQQVLKSPLNHLLPKNDDSNVNNFVIGNNSLALVSGAAKAKELKLSPIILTNTLSGDAAKAGEQLGHFAKAVSFLLHSPNDALLVNQVYYEIIDKTAEALNLDEDKCAALSQIIKDAEILTEYDGICLLLGGETTVKVVGLGLGGRNQELALSAAIKLDAGRNNEWVRGKISVGSMGSDGFDGPCDAAGAVTDSSTLKIVLK